MPFIFLCLHKISFLHIPLACGPIRAHGPAGKKGSKKRTRFRSDQKTRSKKRTRFRPDQKTRSKEDALPLRIRRRDQKRTRFRPDQKTRSKKRTRFRPDQKTRSKRRPTASSENSAMKKDCPKRTVFLIHLMLFCYLPRSLRRRQSHQPPFQMGV